MSGIQNKASIYITGCKKKKIFGLGTVWGSYNIKEKTTNKEKSTKDRHSRWKIKVQWLKVGNNKHFLMMVTPCQPTYQHCFKDKIRNSVPEKKKIKNIYKKIYKSLWTSLMEEEERKMDALFLQRRHNFIVRDDPWRFELKLGSLHDTAVV